MKIINLDKFRSEEVGFEINGKVFKVPNRLPIGSTFVVMDYQQALEEKDTDKLEGVIKAVYSVFAKYNDIEYEEFKELLDSETFTMVLNFLQLGMEPEKTKEIMDSVIEDIDVSGEKKAQNADSGKEQT